jgi:hypothetical protein
VLPKSFSKAVSVVVPDEAVSQCPLMALTRRANSADECLL